jgi:hypothetical protein
LIAFFLSINCSGNFDRSLLAGTVFHGTANDCLRTVKLTESGMSAEKSFYVVREPEWTVVVDTDKEFDGRLVALEVREQKGVFTEPEFISPPNPAREMIDPNSLKDPQDYQGTNYWII